MNEIPIQTANTLRIRMITIAVEHEVAEVSLQEAVVGDREAAHVGKLFYS